jgi:hypothetical protein
MSPLLPQPLAAAETPMQGSLGHIIWTVCYLSVLIGLSAYGVHRYFIIYLFLKNRKGEPVPTRRFEQLPKVTVQLPIFNEVYVVERLLRSVSELDYPRDLLQIQVLDDSTDDTREIVSSCASQLRRDGFNVQRIHRIDRTGFKAGALAAGLVAAEGEFVCILDQMGAFESRLFTSHAHASNFSRWAPFARANCAQSEWPLFQFQWDRRTLAAHMY